MALNKTVNGEITEESPALKKRRGSASENKKRTLDEGPLSPTENKLTTSETQNNDVPVQKNEVFDKKTRPEV